MQEEGGQREVEKEQSIPVAQVETQVLPKNHLQTVSQEGDMPDCVMVKGDSTAAANDLPSNPSDEGPESGQPESAQALFMPPELSPGHELLRPEHHRAMPPIEMIGSLFEATSLNRIIKSMTALYVEGHPLFRQARELDIGAEILARQSAGHYLANQVPRVEWW